MAIEKPTQAPFRFEILPAEGILEVRLSGYLDAERSHDYLRDLAARIKRAKRSPEDRIGLLYFDGLTGFETGRVARTHGEWFNEMRPHLSRVAIVTERMAVTLALSVAKLLSRTPLSQFRNEVEARHWLRTI
jgi:hypothetical protein